MIMGTARRVAWIAIGGINFQPSELAKIAVVLALAHYFGKPRVWIDTVVSASPAYCSAFFSCSDPTRSWHGIDASIWWTGGRICSWFTLEICWARCCGGSGNTHLWMQLHAYQKARVRIFLNPESDALGAGYQITQSKIALGSGGVFGKGFLMGSQSQLNYLTEKQTDFVFTMIGEEFGFAGNVFILFIYLLLTISIMWISFRVQSRFAQLTCIGIAMTVFFYMFVNVAMVTVVASGWCAAALYFIWWYINAYIICCIWNSRQRHRS